MVEFNVQFCMYMKAVRRCLLQMNINRNYNSCHTNERSIKNTIAVTHTRGREATDISIDYRIDVN